MKLGNPKVIFKKHNIAMQGFTKDEVFGIKGGRNDGVHLNGVKGEQAYRESLVSIMEGCGLGRKSTGNGRMGI